MGVLTGPAIFRRMRDASGGANLSTSEIGVALTNFCGAEGIDN